MQLVTYEELLKLPVGTLFLERYSFAHLCRKVTMDTYREFSFPQSEIDAEQLEYTSGDQLLRGDGFDDPCYRVLSEQEILDMSIAFAQHIAAAKPCSVDEVLRVWRDSDRLVPRKVVAKMMAISVQTLRKRELEKPAGWPQVYYIGARSLRYSLRDVEEYIREKGKCKDAVV